MILWRSIQAQCGKTAAADYRPPARAPQRAGGRTSASGRERAARESCVCEYGRESFCFDGLLARESAPAGLAGHRERDRRDRGQQQEEGGPVWDLDMLFFNLLQTGSSEKQV